jgi:hypothetical protein
MATSAQVAPNFRILPSSISIPLAVLSPTKRTQALIPDVQHTSVGGNFRASGFIDLHFNLIVGSEVVSKTVEHNWDAYSRITSPGALGATYNLESQGPAVFKTTIGTFTLDETYTHSNKLGRPPGFASYGPMNIWLRFAPIPEPSSSAVVFSGVAILFARRQRQHETYRKYK